MSSEGLQSIEVFADIWCPFTHVGLRAIAEQRSLHDRSDVVIIVRSWPLELVNGTPLSAAVTKEHVDHLREQVAPDLFRRFDPSRFPTSTLDALALAAAAYRDSSYLGERASFALRDALFENGLDVSDREVLGEIAGKLDLTLPDRLDHDQVIADWHEGQQRGVLGSPHFFCGGIDAFCPSLDITKDPDRGLSIARDATGLIQFVDDCLDLRT
jgi:predicted DsbA family dithiol-disulfide isomerase